MINPLDPDFGSLPGSSQRPQFEPRPVDPAAEPFVTIVTPFYNAADLFEPTARSVMCQSFQQWEWLIVDDGSTEPESLALLERYETLDPRIRVIRQENAGPSAARNRAYREARSDYIAQIDADDLLEPTAIEKWLWFLICYPQYAFVKGYQIGFDAEEYLWTKGFHNHKDFLVANVVQPNCMIRRDVHQEVGGYDEANRAGFEDWDFWLKAACAGHWGGTIPEFLDWYRRREWHGDRWSNWDGATRQSAFRDQLHQRYPQLWKSGMPHIEASFSQPFDGVREEIPCPNPLQKSGPRALMLLPWMAMGGSDRFSLDLLAQMTGRGWEVSIATTLHGESDWAHEFGRYTEDIFILEHFLPQRDYARFLVYLIQSRGIEVVVISHSTMGYLLVPYLRTHCPDVTFVDYCHIEEREWMNGGYPRFAVGYQDVLDLNIVSSQHLKGWLVDRGADPERIAVCYTSIDPETWRRDGEARARVRDELELPDGVTTLLYPARLCDQKRPKLFAEVLRRLRKSKRDFVALVAGDGPDRGWLESFVNRHGLQRQVRFLGKVPASRVGELMSASDVLFLPSEWEGIALSLYEAMAAGLVVVGAEVGGQKELVTAECGYLVPRGEEADEIEAYLQALGECIDDPARRAAMGEFSALRVAEHFTLDEMGDRMIELFDRARQERDRADRPRLTPGFAREIASLGLEYGRLIDLADHLWHTREERLGLSKGWRAKLLGVAYRAALKTPPSVQAQLKRAYHRFFVQT